jgi:hypothetical protein
MLALETSDTTEELAGVGVDDLDFSAAAEIDAPRGGVHGNVVKILAAGAYGWAVVIGFQQMVSGTGSTRCNDRGKQQKYRTKAKSEADRGFNEVSFGEIFGRLISPPKLYIVKARLSRQK